MSSGFGGSKQVWSPESSTGALQLRPIPGDHTAAN